MLIIFKLRKIFTELKKMSLTVYMIFLLILTLITFQYQNIQRYMGGPIVLLVLCVIYSFTKDKIIIENSYYKNTDLPNIVTLNLIFFGLFLYSLLTIIFIKDLNVRPIEYFIVTSILIGICALEIVMLPKKENYVYCIISKIILISISLRTTVQAAFPDGFILYDPWYHSGLTEKIISTGIIPTVYSYSYFPGQHLLFSIESIISRIDNIVQISLLNALVKSAIIIVIIFLIGWKFIKSKKIGLLASLLYSFLDRTIIYDIGFIPTTLAILFLMIILYLLFKKDSEDKNIAKDIVILILMGMLIITHTVTSLFLSILLLLYWIISKIYKDKNYYYKETFILFSCSTIIYWIYASESYLILINVIRWSFKVDDIAFSSLDTTVSYISQIPMSQYMMSYLGFYLFAGFSIFGFLYSFSIKNKNKFYIFLSISGLISLALVFLGMKLNLYVLPDRWWYYSQHILIFTTSYGILIFISKMPNIKKSISIAIIIILISFLNITDPISDIDNPLYSKDLTIRHASTNSEIQSIKKLYKITDKKMLIDSQAASPLYEENNFIENQIVYMDSTILTSRNYAKFDGIIVLREFMLNGNLFDARGMYILDHNPSIYLDDHKFDKIFDSKSIYGFMR